MGNISQRGSGQSPSQVVQTGPATTAAAPAPQRARASPLLASQHGREQPSAPSRLI
jgi:hypothetical protein